MSVSAKQGGRGEGEGESEEESKERSILLLCRMIAILAPDMERNASTGSNR